MGNTGRMIIAGILLLASTPLFAGTESGMDGKSPLLCNFNRLVSCSYGAGECLFRTPEDGNLPEFVEIDFSNKTISGLWPKSQQRVSKLNNLVVLEDRIVAQGMDDNRPWSFVIDRASGDFIGAGPAINEGVSIFGDCMPKR